MIEGGWDGIDVFATSSTLQIHLVLWKVLHPPGVTAKCLNPIQSLEIQVNVPLSLDLVVVERQSLHSMPGGRCSGCCCGFVDDSNAACLNLPGTAIMLSSGFHRQLVFLVLCEREGAQCPNMGQWSHKGCLNQLEHVAGLHQGRALIIPEPTELRRKTEGWAKSGCNNTFPCNNIHHCRSVQDNPWKHLSQVQHWFHTSWLDFPHLECHLRLAACLASLRLVRDLSKVFSPFTVYSIDGKGQWLFPFGVAWSLTSLSGVSSKSKPIAIYLDLTCWSSVAGASLMSSIQS